MAIDSIAVKIDNNIVKRGKATEHIAILKSVVSTKKNCLPRPISCKYGLPCRVGGDCCAIPNECKGLGCGISLIWCAAVIDSDKPHIAKIDIGDGFGHGHIIEVNRNFSRAAGGNGDGKSLPPADTSCTVFFIINGVFECECSPLSRLGNEVVNGCLIVDDIRCLMSTGGELKLNHTGDFIIDLNADGKFPAVVAFLNSTALDKSVIGKGLRKVAVECAVCILPLIGLDHEHKRFIGTVAAMGSGTAHSYIIFCSNTGKTGVECIDFNSLPRLFLRRDKKGDGFADIFSDVFGYIRLVVADALQGNACNFLAKCGGIGVGCVKAVDDIHACDICCIVCHPEAEDIIAYILCKGGDGNGDVFTAGACNSAIGCICRLIGCINLKVLLCSSGGAIFTAEARWDGNGVFIAADYVGGSEVPLRITPIRGPGAVYKAAVGAFDKDFFNLVGGYLTAEFYCDFLGGSKAAAVCGRGVNNLYRITLQVEACEVEYCLIGIGTVIQILTVCEGVTEGYLKEQRGDVHAVCKVDHGIHACVSGIVAVRKVSHNNKRRISGSYTFKACAVACINKLCTGYDFNTVIREPRLKLSTVNLILSDIIVCRICLNLPRLISGFTVVTLKITVGGKSSNICVNCRLKLGNR